MATKTLTTPVGIARYPHLNRPDTKFDEIGKYKVDLEMTDEEAAPFIAQLDEIFAPYLAAKKTELRKPNVKIADMPWVSSDGMTQLKLRVNPTGTNKKTGETWSRQPTLFNLKGEIITDNIGGGSRLKVAVIPYCWYVATKGVGITLQPKAVQVLDLVTWGSGTSAESYGFDVVEAPQPTVKNGTNDGEEPIEW